MVKLDRLPKTTWLVADSYNSYCLSPLQYSPDRDIDGDGVNDSWSVVLPSWVQSGLCFRHNGFANFVFVDGSVRPLKPRDYFGNSSLW